MYRLVVLKFGGTSIKDAEAMRRSAAIVCARGMQSRTRPLVVLSACAGTTNALLSIAELALRPDTTEATSRVHALQQRHEQIANELLPEPQLRAKVHAQLAEIWGGLHKLIRGVNVLQELTPKAKDQFQSIGERCSTLIFHAYLTKALRASKTDVKLYDAREFFITSGDFTVARPLQSEIRRRMQKIRRELERGAVGITQGFIGSSATNEVTTIGRGGSDFSAAIQGVAIGAKEIQIWTDVAGILTADPRLVPKARTVPTVSFRDASQLAFFGAKVLHPETIWPAVEEGIPVLVLSSLDPDNACTTIVHSNVAPSAVTGIAIKRDVVLVKATSLARLPSPAAQEAVWMALMDANVVPLATALSVDSALYAFDDANAVPLIRAASEGLAEIEVATKKALITLVGEGLRKSTGIGIKVFQALGKLDCEMITYGGCDTAVSFVIDGVKAEHTMRKLHARFFERAQRPKR